MVLSKHISSRVSDKALKGGSKRVSDRVFKGVSKGVSKIVLLRRFLVGSDRRKRKRNYRDS